MKEFSNSLIRILGSLAAFLLVLFAASFFVVEYVDRNYGGGTSGIIAILFIGIGITVALFVVFQFFTDRAADRVNETHRAAGEDAAEFIKGISAPLTQIMRGIAQDNKGVADRVLVDRKLEADRERVGFRYEDFLSRIGVKRRSQEEDARRKRETAQEEEEEAWNWDEIDNGEDGFLE